MRDIHHRQAQRLLQIADFLAHIAPQLGVQIGQGLVEQQHTRLQHDGACHRNPLLLPAREFVRVTRTEQAQPELFEHILGLGGHHLLGKSRHLQAVTHVLQHRHVRKKRVGLEHHRHITCRGRQPGHIVVTNQDAPAAGHLQAGDQTQNGGLAASGRAEQRDQRAGREIQ